MRRLEGWSTTLVAVLRGSLKLVIGPAKPDPLGGSHLRTTTTIEQMAKMAKQTNAAVAAADKAAALALTPVSRQTELRLDRYVDLLLVWQVTSNLVAPSSVR